MSVISVDKLKGVVEEFARDYLVPSAPPPIAFTIAIAAQAIIRNFEFHKQAILPKLESAGVLTEQKQIDIEAVKSVLLGAFEWVPRVPYGVVTITKQDGEALLTIMEKHRDG